MNIEKVFIASASKIKIDAVHEGLKELRIDPPIEGLKVQSNVSDQPIGFDETFRGAQNRLKNLRNALQDLAGNHLLIALENGLWAFGERTNYFDTALCLVEDPSGQIEMATSTGVQIPDEVANHIIDNDLEVGPYMMEKYGIQEKDPAAVLTGGKVTRSEILSLAVKMAVGRLFNRLDNQINR